MKRLLPVAIVCAALSVGALATILPAGGQSPSPSEGPSASPSSTPSPTPSASAGATPQPTTIIWETPAPVEPQPWSPPEGYTGTLRPGVWAQITGTDSCLNARPMPGMTTPDGAPSPVLNCLPDGFVGRIPPAWSTAQMPIHADGYWWWYIMGQGWVAEDWLAFYHEDGMPFPPRPELAAAGLIAFLRADGLWLMNADGSEARNIVSTGGTGEGISSVRWSPDGQSLVYGATVWNQATQQTQYISRSVNLQGAVLAEYPGIIEPAWSPDGRWLSGLRVEQEGGLGGYRAVPVVIDVAALGVETAMGPASFQFAAAIWSPDSAAVAYTCVSYTNQVTQPDGTVQEDSLDCGGDGLRIAPIAGGAPQIVLPLDQTWSFLNPSWSPDGRTIAGFATGLGAPCRGYVLIDIASASISTCLELGEGQYSGFQCGGSAESGATDWSADSRLLAYHWQSGQGENGIAIIDVETGSRHVVPTTGAWSVAFSPDGEWLVFAAEGYLWVSDIDGATLTLLGEGSLPAWQP